MEKNKLDKFRVPPSLKLHLGSFKGPTSGLSKALFTTLIMLGGKKNPSKKALIFLAEIFLHCGWAL